MYSQRSLLPYRHTVDLRAMSGNLSNSIPAICSDAMAEPLLSIANSDDPLAIAIPSKVIYPPRDNGELPFRSSFALAIPNPYRSRHIPGSNIVPRGREPRNGSCVGMAGVLRTNRRMVYRTQKYRLAICVGDALSTRI